MTKRINVKLILELDASGMSQNDIVATRHFAKKSVSVVLKIKREKGFRYDDLKDMNDDALYQLFFPDKLTTVQIYQLPDYDYVHQELKRVGVTLKLLWQEYKDDCQKNGSLAVRKTKFCDDYRKYTSEKAITNHLDHKPGQSCEVDWSGPTMKIVNPIPMKR